MYPYTDKMEQLYRKLSPDDLYYAHWQQFRKGMFLRAWGGCIFVPILFILWLLTLLVMPVTAGWFTSCIIAFGLFMIVPLRYPLNCPACRCRFYDPFPLNRYIFYRQEDCHNCGLQLYAPHGNM